MSTSHRRKRKRESSPDFQIAYQAEQEAQAIDGAFRPRTMDFGKRLNQYYWMDGERFNTGKKHRRQAVGMSQVERGERRKLRSTKQRNLLSEAVHKRIANPELYKTLKVRQVLHLIEYRTGRVEPLI